jgi:hypothetical protein
MEKIPEPRNEAHGIGIHVLDRKLDQKTTASPENDSNLTHVVALFGFVELSAGRALKRVKDGPNERSEREPAFWCQNLGKSRDRGSKKHQF